VPVPTSATSPSAPTSTTAQPTAAREAVPGRHVIRHPQRTLRRGWRAKRSVRHMRSTLLRRKR
jgi:hypothetical protein